MAGITVKPILACNFGCSGCYESEIFRLNNNSPETYDLKSIIEGMHRSPSGPCTLHGGEITLMPVKDLRVICEAAHQQGRRINMQTNASIITDELLDLMVEFQISAGVSLNGPGALNRDRQIGDIETTDKMTQRVHKNIERMRERGIEVGIITVLSQTNAARGSLLSELIDWAESMGNRFGIWGFRFNPLHEDTGQNELHPNQAAAAYSMLADATLADKRKMWNPFREFTDNLFGLGLQPCWVGRCDVYSTDAVFALFGDGSAGNCLRTAKAGIPYLRAGDANDLRESILQQIAMEDGGCGGCRFWRVCHGGCPAEAVNSDWRNKSRFCQMYQTTYAHLINKFQAMMPNFTPITEWTTNDEADLMRSVQNRHPRVDALNPANPNWSVRPSLYSPSARVQK